MEARADDAADGARPKITNRTDSQEYWRARHRHAAWPRPGAARGRARRAGRGSCSGTAPVAGSTPRTSVRRPRPRSGSRSASPGSSSPTGSPVAEHLRRLPSWTPPGWRCSLLCRPARWPACRLSQAGVRQALVSPAGRRRRPARRVCCAWRSRCIRPGRREIPRSRGSAS